MSQFIAIFVGAGDAFFLERNGRTFLVDGGRSEHNFPDLFHKATSRNAVDVVICTHNDADHTNGIIGFLKAGFGCSEIWLPGTWSKVLPHVLGSVADVISNLEEEIWLQKEEFGRYRFDTPHLRRATSELMDNDLTQSRPDLNHLNEQGWPKSLEVKLDEAEAWHIKRQHIFREDCRESIASIASHSSATWSEPELNRLWKAIKTANRIREIATEAYKRQIKVRWFEYDTQQPSGGETYLMPLNAKELVWHQNILPYGSLYLMLTLSVANQRSLVFWSPSAGDQPGVLFTADSDLKNITLPSDISHAIVTTPHHGSKANARAYTLLSKIKGFNTTTWVRSDGRYQSRPCSDYLNMKQHKFCTSCRQGAVGWSNHQHIRLLNTQGLWAFIPRIGSCNCS
jgi:hypothetical protein